MRGGLDLVDNSLSGEGVLLSLLPEILVDGEVLELGGSARAFVRRMWADSRSGRT